MKKALHCDFDSRFIGNSQPSCFAGKPEYTITIQYNDFDKDILTTCQSCRDFLIRDCKRYNYKIKTNSI